MQGGCCCKSVRYRVVGEPVLSVLCFCNACLAAFGCDGYPGMMVNNEDFELLEGETSRYTRPSDAGRQVTRHFCPKCGTNLWGQTELGLISIAAGTLDNPNQFRPTRAVFTEQAPNWARIPNHLECD